MAAYLELHVVGDGRAFIETSMIGAVITGKGCDVLTPGTPTTPVRVLLRNGETLDVIGDSAGKILVRAMDARKEAKLRKDAGAEEFFVDQLSKLEDPDGP